jgi:hypothetical protein
MRHESRTATAPGHDPQTSSSRRRRILVSAVVGVLIEIPLAFMAFYRQSLVWGVVFHFPSAHIARWLLRGVRVELGWFLYALVVIMQAAVWAAATYGYLVLAQRLRGRLGTPTAAAPEDAAHGEAPVAPPGDPCRGEHHAHAPGNSPVPGGDAPAEPLGTARSEIMAFAGVPGVLVGAAMKFVGPHHPALLLVLTTAMGIALAAWGISLAWRVRRPGVLAVAATVSIVVHYSACIAFAPLVLGSGALVGYLGLVTIVLLADVALFLGLWIAPRVSRH